MVPGTNRLGLLLTAGALTAQAAIAADIPVGWHPRTPSQVATAANAPSWYARGDFGLGWFRAGGAETAPGFPAPSDGDIGSRFVFGGGLGYKRSWLRADATLDYSRIDYSGRIATAGDTTAKFGAVTALFNGYLDLGTWYGLTPYVGAGAGTSFITTSDYASALAPPFTPGLSNSQWNFSWAVMTGAALSVTRDVAVDLGYRYLNLGDASTASDAAGATTLKNLAAHEVRVGVRWNFDDVRIR